MDFKSFVNYEEFESKKFEFKEIVSHKNYEKWAKTIVAFANSDGGKIFFGVDDDENAIGISKEQVKNDILYINDIVDKKIHPRVKYSFEKIKIDDDLFVIEVEVFKNDNTPVWLTRTDDQDVIYVRRDGQSVIAHGDQIEELVLSSKRKPYDVEITDRPYSELSFTKLTRLYQDMHNFKEEITLKKLQSINALSIDGFASRGLLLFEDNCDYRNCNVACRTWPELTKGSSKLIDKKEFRGNIVDLLDFARNYINFYTKNGLIKNDGKGRKDIVSYPERAIEEALINAVAHRDYYVDGSQIDIDIFENRIEITSPGSFLLPGKAQDYAINRIPSRRRNEVICGILELCDLMEASGSGFEKIVECYKDYSKEYQPQVYSDPAQFIITLYDTTYDMKKNNEEEIEFEFKSPRSGNRIYDRKILAFCLEEPKSRMEIQEYLGLKNRKSFVSSILNPLLDLELLIPTSSSPYASNQKYYTNKSKLVFKEQ